MLELCVWFIEGVLFVEMVELMKKVVKFDVEFIVEECNFLFVGYKNVIGVWRVLW